MEHLGEVDSSNKLQSEASPDSDVISGVQTTPAARPHTTPILPLSLCRLQLRRYSQELEDPDKPCVKTQLWKL